MSYKIIYPVVYRMCIGKRFAEEEGILLLALLLAKLEVSLHAIDDKPVVDPTTIVLSEIPTVANVTLTFRQKMSLRFEALPTEL